MPPGIYNVFYVNLLRRVLTDPLPSQEVDNSQPLLIVNDEGEEEHGVKEIL